MPIKPSKEELEAFWKRDEKTRARLYAKRMLQIADKAELLGKLITYAPPNNSLDEVTITALKPRNPGLSTDDKIDLGITAIGLVPGLDTVADIADVGNQLRLRNYGNAALSVGLAFIPGLSAPIVRKGWDFVKNKFPEVRFSLPKSQNNYYRVLDDSVDDKAEDAVLDILDTGIIRSNPKGTRNSLRDREHYIGPYFYKGKTFLPKLGRLTKVIVGKDMPEVDWLPIGPHLTELRMVEGSTLFTPLVNGVPNQSPSKYFDLYERGTNPITRHLWFKRKIANSAKDPDPFNYGGDSNIMVHLDYGDSNGAFSNLGAYILNGFLFPGKSKNLDQLDYTWFNKGKPYAMGVGGKPFTRAIIGQIDNIPGLILVRQSKIPIGLWNGKSGFVLPSEHVTLEPIDMENMLLFTRQSDGRFKLNRNSDIK